MNGITDSYIREGTEYIRKGEYYIPKLKAPEQVSRETGRYGIMHKAYLKVYRYPEYVRLLMKGGLMEYLAEINERTETLKEEVRAKILSQTELPDKEKNSAEYTATLRAIAEQAEEIAVTEIVYGS